MNNIIFQKKIFEQIKPSEKLLFEYKYLIYILGVLTYNCTYGK